MPACCRALQPVNPARKGCSARLAHSRPLSACRRSRPSGVNFNALNPLYKDPNASTSTASAQPTDEDIAREWMRKALFASDAKIPQVGGYWGDGGTQTAQDLRKMLGQKDPLQNLWMG